MAREAIIYARISSPQQSLGSQEQACMDYCNRNNIKVICIENEVSSARKIKNQKKLVNIIKYNRNIDIIVYSADRFSRNLEDCMKICQKMKERNINLISVSDQIDLSTASGTHAFRMRISTAQLESDLISERVKRGIQFKKARGEYTGKSVYGKNYEEKKVIEFIQSSLDKPMTSTIFNKKLYRLLDIFEKPDDFYVPAVFEEGDTEIKRCIVNAEMIADILNDYEIFKREKAWKPTMIRYLCSASQMLKRMNL